MTTSKVTPEMIEAVAKAISSAAWDNMKAQGFSGGWDHDELSRAIAQAAILAMQSTQPEAPLMGWQPIETAPKDGSPLRLHDPTHADEEMGSSFDGHWTDCRDDGTPGFVAAIWNNCQDCFGTVSVNPTHWMPPPKPPAQEAQV